MYMPHETTGCSLSLIAMAVGYLVLLKASKEAKLLKLLGLIIGTIVIASTLLMGVGKLLYCAKSGTCGMMGDKKMIGGSSSCPAMPAGQK